MRHRNILKSIKVVDRKGKTGKKLRHWFFLGDETQARRHLVTPGASVSEYLSPLYITAVMKEPE